MSPQRKIIAALLVSATGLVLFCLFLSITAQSVVIAADRQEPYPAQHLKLTQRQYVDDPQIQYLRDSRTNLCFAFMWISTHESNGGPALAYAPCQNIPKHLITNIHEAENEPTDR